MSQVFETPNLDRPPSYTTVDAPHNDPGAHASRDAGSSTGREVSPPTFELQRIGAALDVLHNGSNLYHVSSYELPSHPDMILYAGYDAKGPRLATVEFMKGTKNIRVYVGGLKRPTGDDWDVVRCADNGRWFDAPVFRFETRPAAAQEASWAGKLKLHWTKASKLSISDFKLIDESDDRVVAEYTEGVLSSFRTVRGKVIFHAKLDEMSELVCLVVLFAVLEKVLRQSRGPPMLRYNGGFGSAAGAG